MFTYVVSQKETKKKRLSMSTCVCELLDVVCVCGGVAVYMCTSMKVLPPMYSEPKAVGE